VDAPAERPGGSRADWAYLLACPFLLLAPLTTFVAHAGYPFLAPEMLLCMLAVGGTGLLCGAVLAIAPVWLRVFGAPALVSLVIDVQTRWFASLGLRKVSLIVVGVAALCWLLRERLGPLLAVVAGVLWLTSFLVPATASWRLRGEAGNAKASGRPPFVQIILDEHVGIEAIPREFDPDTAIANRVRGGLEQRGFTVFTRAYSRYFDTSRSIPAALNFAAPGGPNPFVEDLNRRPLQMLANATISQLRERGYQVHVVDTEYLDLCNVSGQPVADECASYTLNTIASIRDLPASARTKAGMILDMLVHRSELDLRIRLALGWSEPRRLTAVSTLRASDSIVSLLRGARLGDAYLIHMMFPHFPYAFDSECRLRPDPKEWLDRADPAAAPHDNKVVDSRRRRYSRYLEQVICTQKLLSRMFDALVEAGVFDQSIVLVHGDHGSRITAAPPEPPFLDEMAPRDYIDAFATLFAAKLPGVAGGIDRRVLPLENLTAAVARDERLPADAVSEPPFVWVKVGSTHFDQRPLPPFAHGSVGAESADGRPWRLPAPPDRKARADAGTRQLWPLTSGSARRKASASARASR
jgi:hypothetical protein